MAVHNLVNIILVYLDKNVFSLIFYEIVMILYGNWKEEIVNRAQYQPNANCCSHIIIDLLRKCIKNKAVLLGKFQCTNNKIKILRSESNRVYNISSILRFYNICAVLHLERDTLKRAFAFIIIEMLVNKKVIK